MRRYHMCGSNCREEQGMACRADAPALAAAAPAGGDASVRALKQGDIQAPRHYWDTSEEGIGLEQPLKVPKTSLKGCHIVLYTSSTRSFVSP